MKRVAIYLRVSTEEQKRHGLSVEAQQEALEQYCKDNNYTIINTYNDAGFSASKSYKTRPALLSLLADCEAGLIDLIIFTKLDRWFRSLPDYYEVQRVLDKSNVKWRAIWEDYETETSSGVFKVNIMLSIAQAESERTSERIKAVFEHKKANGGYIGTPPMGYKRVDKKYLVKDPEKEAIINLIFKTYLETHSSSATARKVQALGVNMTPHSLARILNNPAYAGTVQGNKCEAYITPAQFEEVQKIRKSFIREPKNIDVVYMFSGLVRCKECGARTRALYATCNGKRYNNYQCRGFENVVTHEIGVSMSERKIEKYLLTHLDALLSEYNFKCDNSTLANIKRDNDKARAALEARLERIGIRFEMGDYTIEEYKQKRFEIQNEINKLKITPIPKRIDLPDNWRDIYTSFDVSHKRAFWNKIIDKIVIGRDRNIEVYFLEL